MSREKGSKSEWMRTTLGRLCGQRGQSIDPSKTPDNTFELYSIPSFPGSQPEIVAGKEIGSNKQLVEPRAVLLGKINPRINRAWVVGNFTQHTKLASTEWIVFPPLTDIEPQFLCYFLQQNQIRDYLASNASGVGGSLMRVKPSTLNEFPFAYPNCDEQRQIVAEIEKQFTRLEAGVAGLRRVQANLKRYRAAVLKAACEGKLVPTEAELARQEGRTYETGAQLLERILTERRKKWTGKGKYKEPVKPSTVHLPQLPDGWTWATMDAVIVSGPQNGIYLPKESYGLGHPILRIDDYQDGWVRSRDELNKVTADLEIVKTYQLRGGDLVINRVNSPSHLGKCLIVRDALAPALFESNMMRATLSDVIHPLHVEFYLRSVNGRARLNSNAKWAVNQASINQQDVKSTALPLPSFAEQQRIVAEVERRLSVVEELETVVNANLQRATRLRQSILKRAFERKLDVGERL